jgi:hypothetical protein
MRDRDLAEDILEIYKRLREFAIEDPETPDEEVGVELSFEEVLQGVRLSDLDETEEMLIALGEMEDDDDAEALADIFLDWLQQYVYEPLADEAIGKLVDKGYMECTGLDADGEFIFKTTKKGEETKDWNIDD